MSEPSIYPVILAGGASSRLWPASGRERPKWDLRLFGPRNQNRADGQPQSLLEGAWERGRGVAPAAHCFVVAGSAQAELIRTSLPELPQSNLLIEPEPRDTSGAVAYAAAAILRQAAGSANEAAMFVLPGDHVISQLDKFKRCALTAAQAAVQLQALMTFGIIARSPATAYGYIHRGKPVALAGSQAGAPPVFDVRQFREKPDLATAQQYVASGEYFWNGGIFMWTLASLMHEFQTQLPGHARMIEALRAVPGGAGATGGADWQTAARAHFPELKKTSIDFGIMEHAKKVATVTADFDWDDIGSWSAVAAHLDSSSGNATGPGTQVLPLDAKDNLVFAPGKRVALIGVEGLAVVQHGDEILICRLDRDQDVKQISAKWSK
jgi:mannose-1-phosphate guanylyltransferase